MLTAAASVAMTLLGFELSTGAGPTIMLWSLAVDRARPHPRQDDYIVGARDRVQAVICTYESGLARPASIARD